MILSSSRAHLVIVDMQERLMPAILDSEATTKRAEILLKGAQRLGVPVTVTEQYPKGLGPTLPSLVEALPEGAGVLPKTAFSAMGDQHIARRIAMLRGEGRDQIVMAGVEAHVCVLQTALAMKEQGLSVFVVADAVSSRAAASVSAACARLLHAGCHWVTTEMVLFEWLERAGTEDFRALSALIK